MNEVPHVVMCSQQVCACYHNSSFIFNVEYSGAIKLLASSLYQTDCHSLACVLHVYNVVRVVMLT